MSEESDCKHPLRTNKSMNKGIVSLFKSFMLNKDYNEAMDLAVGCFGYVPIPYVINEILFEIMLNCNTNLAYKAAEYLEGRLRVMSSHKDQLSGFIKALNEQTSTNRDAWNVFSHYVWSSLYHLKVSEACHSHKEYVKSPNCDILVELYIKVFLKCSIKRDILGSRAEERLSSLLKWINLFYKYSFWDGEMIYSLHNLLDCIVDSEISSDPSLPSCVKINRGNSSPYSLLILNICKDVFVTPEKQWRFFTYSSSTYLITKVCQYHLQEQLEVETSLGNPGILTLKSIVDNYFFPRVKKSKKRSSNQGQQLKKFSKEAIDGDTNLHKYCRLGKPADLLGALLTDKSLDINARNSAGNTPLHEACLSSSFNCCQFLIEQAGGRKVDFRASENGGRTPLHCAVHVNAFDIVQLLLDKGGNDLIKCQDKWGKEPIDYSSSDEMEKMLQEIESKLGGNELKLPKLQNSKDYHLYLQTLRKLVSNYCEIYDLPKTETDVRTLSHDGKECYHYKAGRETLCMEDYSTLETFREVIKKFISCAKLVSEESAKKELIHWNRFAATFK